MTSQIQGNLISPGSTELKTPPRDSAGEPPLQPSALDPMWRLIKRLPAYARLSTALARDPRIPAAARAMLIGGGVYLVSPVDLVPGFIPVAGQLDDLYVLLMGLRGAIRLSPPGVIEEHFARVGLPVAIVDEDLAAIRTFVRRGLKWTVDNGGKALSRMSRSATSLARRARQGRQGR
ncbi:MAG: DUF1232 domain-containing protein, partial [Thermomicrobiales bacterium]